MAFRNYVHVCDEIEIKLVLETFELRNGSLFPGSKIVQSSEIFEKI